MITKDSRILNQTQGYFKIEEAESPLSIWAGDKTLPSTVECLENQEIVTVVLMNGIEINCSLNQGFRTMQKQLSGDSVTQAKDLEKTHLVYLSQNVYEFDYLNLECYNYLNNLSSYELGVLSGFLYCLGFDGKVIDIPKVRKEVYRALEEILNKANVPFSKESYYKRADRNKYSIQDESFVNEISPFLVTGEIPSIFFSSKIFWAGFLKAIFTFCIIGNEMLTIRADKNTNILKEIQQALLLFGINSTWSKGLKVSQLLVFRDNCYRLANNIGIFDVENLFPGLDYKRFLKYNDRTKSDMRYSRVKSVREFGVGQLFNVKSKQFMANGAILENYE